MKEKEEIEEIEEIKESKEVIEIQVKKPILQIKNEKKDLSKLLSANLND